MIAAAALCAQSSSGFNSQIASVKQFRSAAAILSAKPARLEANEEGVLYVYIG